MPAPDVHIVWEDLSNIPAIDNSMTDNTDYPVIMTVISADKGPEEWKTAINADLFYKYYGRNISFAKHGQPLLQAANAVDAGARLTVKRVVAEDATLANIGVKANVRVDYVQGTDAATGANLYIDTNGNITTVPQYNSEGGIDENSIYNVPQINVSFELVSVVLADNDVKAFANTFYAANKHTNNIGTSGSYALFLILDNGRGESKKRFRIYRDTSRSAPVRYVRYFIEISEEGTIEPLETLAFTMNPDIIEKNVNSSLDNVILRKSNQIRSVFFEDEFRAFTENVSYLAGLEDNQYAFADCLFGTDLYGNQYTRTPNGGSINVSQSPVNLASVYGIQLHNGSNGEFGEAPITAATYPLQVTHAFDGSFDDNIYDLDNNRIDAIFDANYPEVVKRAIETLVQFREDCMFFRDLGLDVKNLADIDYKVKEGVSPSRFEAVYISSYDIFDPYTRKQISVTMMYDLVRLFVNHFINGRSRPFCGQRYGVVIPQNTFVRGTLNYGPKLTPAADQKAELDTLRVNYCAFYEGTILAVASEYTSQLIYTQLSFINNVLAVQEVIKAIRVVCPKIRYSFIDEGSDDFARYKEDVNNLIISRYAQNFKTCTIEYVTDDVYTLNKIIYAVIRVRFRDFVQTEYFKITALI